MHIQHQSVPQTELVFLTRDQWNTSVSLRRGGTSTLLSWLTSGSEGADIFEQAVLSRPSHLVA